MKILFKITKLLPVIGLFFAIAAMPALAETTNLLPNANFENPAGTKGMPTGWSYYQYGPAGSNGSVSQDATAGRNGSAAIRAENSDEKASSGAYTHVKLEPGTYQLSVWARAEKGQTALMKMYLASEYSPQIQIGDQWREVSFTVTLPTLTQGIDSAEINFQNCSGKTSTVWFDDAILQEIPSPLLAPDNKFAAVTGKKLIEYGWDVPTPDYVRDHIQEMEKRPFEGIMFRLPLDGGNVFDPGNWEKNKAALQDQLKVASSIKWHKFTDNFLGMYAASTMNWYSDSDWEKVLSAVKFNAQVAKAAGCVGLLFDPEPYGTNPWDYPKQEDTAKYSYAQYSQKVYQRGQQFMDAMQSQNPDVKVLMFHQYQMLYDVTHNPDPAKREATLAAAAYGLYLPFLNGMLSAIKGNAQMIDGNENSYYYQNPTQFYTAYWQMREGAKVDVPKELWGKYETNEKAAQALYVDRLFSLRPETFGYQISAGMTPEERAQWFEQNTYYALKTSQEYVWLYSEKMNWWTDTGLPPGLQNAVLAAKTKLMNGQELGYSLESTFTSAQVNLNKLLQDKLQKRSATLPHLSAAQVPQIDGKLDEAIYSQSALPDAFVSFLNRPALAAATHAYAAYDANNLYLAFRCDEPDMKDQQVAGGGHDSSIWNGESVEISLLKPGQPTDSADAVFYHFILNPANDHWDALNTGTNSDTGYDPKWQSATSKSADGWTAEIAIPWQEIGVTNAHSGLQIRANLSRQRVNGEIEYSSWSQFVSGFQEPQNFGTWTLQ